MNTTLVLNLKKYQDAKSGVAIYGNFPGKGAHWNTD
jgi:hypothetical protein